MGLEGAVRLGCRREPEAIEDPGEREREFARRVAEAYERGMALNPAETRRWISTMLCGARPRRGVRPCIDM